MGRKRKNGAAMLLNLRGQSNEAPQDMQEQNYGHSGPEIGDASGHQSNGDDISLSFQTRSSARVALLQKRRGQQKRRGRSSAALQDLEGQNYDPEQKSGSGMLIKLSRKSNAVSQDLQKQNDDNEEPENDDEPNGGNSIMAQKHKSKAALRQKLSGQPNALVSDFQELSDDNWEPDAEDASRPQLNDDNNSVMSQKLTSSGEEMLQKLIAQLNAVPQGLQEENYDNRELETEGATCTQPNGDNNSLTSQKRNSAKAAMSENLRVEQHNAASQDLQDHDHDNRELETEDVPSLSNAGSSVLGRKRKSRAAVVGRLRGRHNAVPQDLPDNSEPQTEGASGSKFNGDNSLMGLKTGASMLQKTRGQLNVVPQGLRGAAMLQNLRGQPNAVPQELPEQNHENGESENEDEPSPRSNGGNSLMGRKRKTGAALLQKLKGPLNADTQGVQGEDYTNKEPQTEGASCSQFNGVNNSLNGQKCNSVGATLLQQLRGQQAAVPQGLQEEDYDNRELETEDAPSPQPNGDNNSLMSRKRKSANTLLLQKLRGQLNDVPRDLQGQNYDNREHETEDASCPQFNGDDNSLLGLKRNSAVAGLLQKLKGKLDAGSLCLLEQNYDNREPETDNGPTLWSKMGQKRKRGSTMLQMLRGQSSSVPQDLPVQHSDTESEEAVIPLSDDDQIIASTSKAKAKKQKKFDPLLVQIIDIETKVTSLRKMTADEVWDLEKNLKIIVQLNGNGQGEDNGANLLVRFLGKLSKNQTICPISVKGWPKMPKDKIYQQWKCIEDHFLFDYAAGCKWVMGNLGDKWRTYKYNLRRDYFTPNKTKEEVVANSPPGIDGAHWAIFVEHYYDSDTQRKCLQNSLNREKLKAVHYGGSKSHARKTREMVEKLGRSVCRAEVVVSSMIRKDGTFANEEGKKVVGKLLKYLPRDQALAATLPVSTTMIATPNDAVEKVFGADRHGYVRGMGPGVTPSKVFGISGLVNHTGSSKLMSSIVEERIGNLVKEVDTLQEKLKGYEDIKECIGELVNQMLTLQKKVRGYDEMKTQLAQARSELRDTKTQLLQSQLQVANLYKFLEDYLD